MAVWSEIALTEIEHGRVDSEFYQPFYLDAYVKAGKKKLKHYGAEVLHPTEVKRTYSNAGLEIVLAQNNRDNDFDWSEKRFMPKSMRPTLDKNLLQFGDVIVTRSGANYGQTSVITIETMQNDLFACADLLIIKPGNLDGCLLATFLNTKIGKNLMQRGVYGAGQPHVAPGYVKEIPIPEYLLSYSSNIQEVILKSRVLKEKSHRLYIEAQKILEQELGLDKLEFEKPVGYEVSFSTISESRIIDSKYHDPKYKILEDNLKHNFKTYKLKEIAKVEYGYMPTQDYETDPQKGIPLIRVTNIKDDLEVVNSDLKYIPKSVKVPNKKFVEQNDILMVQCGDTTGKVGYIFDDIKGYLFPSFCLSVKVLDDKFNPLFLAALLKTRYMQILFDQTVMINTVRPNTTKPRFENLEIPLFDEEFQSRIANLLIKSKQLKYESKQLLEKAKQMVEDLIEEAAG